MRKLIISEAVAAVELAWIMAPVIIGALGLYVMAVYLVTQ